MKFSYIPLIIGLLFTGTTAFAQADLGGKDSALPDVRILIDISGSMKKNDPKNLRVPALKLITQLLPEGSQGGVWSFGQYVNMLVKRGEINKAWKEGAYASAEKINSLGMRTNIGGVLDDATWDWRKSEATSSRSIIFLTDGVVDISKDAQINRVERERILSEVLPRLKQAGVTIHTIALSDDADKTFLRQLSAATSGWYEEAKEAAQLERLFLRMFEKSVPVESVPLTDNKVLVDDSISELTLLVFRKEGAQEVGIRLPNGEVINHRKKPDSVNWRHEERYDLITVASPAIGEWTVNADLDPDNRVLVVTDLNVRASRLPNLLLLGDQFPYYVELHEKDTVISKAEFLDFVSVTINQALAGGQRKRLMLDDNGEGVDKTASDGRFSTMLGEGLEAGEYEYELVVNGTTFKRSKSYVMQVVDKPVAVTVNEVEPGDPARYSLTLTPYAELINADALLIDTVVTKKGGSSSSINLPKTGPSEWRLDMDVKKGDVFDVAIQVQAERKNGKSISVDLGSFRLGEGDIDIPPPKKMRQEEVAPPAIELPKIPEPTPVSEEPAEEEGVAEEEQGEEVAEEGELKEEPPNWIMVAAKVIGLNLVLIGLGYFGYRKFIAKPKAKEDDEEESDEKTAIKEEGADK